MGCLFSQNNIKDDVQSKLPSGRYVPNRIHRSNYERYQDDSFNSTEKRQIRRVGCQSHFQQLKIKKGIPIFKINKDIPNVETTH